MAKFKKKTRLYKVYHIHMIGNYDLSDGYVGVTRRSLKMRLGQHFNSKRPIGKILRTIDKNQISIDELKRLNRVEALDMEFKLRSQRFIGWNCQAGGNRSTVACPGCGKLLPKRRLGSYCIDCNDCRFPKGHTPHNYGQGEKYQLTDPNGIIYTPEIFTVFCRDKHLTPQNLRKVAKGKRKHHKGWTAIKLS
jgi:hypothetical protein